MIDDDRAVQRLFERTLSQDGYCVACVKSGHEALVLTRNTAFDLVVLDLSLGDMDGFRLLNEIRSESPFARVPGCVRCHEIVPARHCERRGSTRRAREAHIAT